MDRNVRIAKQLVRLAKSLVAADQGAFDGEITIGNDERIAGEGAFDNEIAIGSTRTAGIYNVEDEETKNSRKRQEQRDQNLRDNPKNLTDVLRDVVNKFKNQFNLKGNKITYNNWYSSVTSYLNGKDSKYGKIEVMMGAKIEQKGKNAEITVESYVSDDDHRSEVFDTSKIVLKPGTSSCKIEVSGNDIVFYGSNSRQAEEFANDAYNKLISGLTKASSFKLRDKLYKMNTPWIKRLFGIGK